MSTKPTRFPTSTRAKSLPASDPTKDVGARFPEIDFSRSPPDPPNEVRNQMTPLAAIIRPTHLRERDRRAIGRKRGLGHRAVFAPRTGDVGLGLLFAIDHNEMPGSVGGDNVLGLGK